jgi:hypothetical protein
MDIRRRWFISLIPITMLLPRWSILAMDPGVVITTAARKITIEAIVDTARKITWMVTTTATEIQPNKVIDLIRNCFDAKLEPSKVRSATTRADKAKTFCLAPE